MRFRRVTNVVFPAFVLLSATSAFAQPAPTAAPSASAAPKAAPKDGGEAPKPPKKPGKKPAEPAPKEAPPAPPTEPAEPPPAPKQPDPRPATDVRQVDNLLPNDQPVPPTPQVKAQATGTEGASTTTKAETTPEEDKAAEARAAEEAKKKDEEAKKPKGDGTESDTQVFADEWWAKARPVFEIHGYYRVRAEFFSHFALGRKDVPSRTMWPNPPSKDFLDGSGGGQKVLLCGDDPLKPEACDNNINAGANMRFRLNPELHISDNVRVMAQIDLLDNIVLGSTPEGYANNPADGGYSVAERGGYSPLGAFAATQWSPSAGQNSFTDSIVVKRVWGEYMTPIGLLRFGRMPSHWGLGMLANDGNAYDSDSGSTADRIMFLTGIKSWDLYFGGLWDFTNEGPTSALVNERGGQPYDLTQADDVDQYGLIVVRRRNPELAKLDLARGDVVVNGGFYGVYRNQSLDALDAPLGATRNQVSTGYIRRGAEAFIPDVWFQFMWKKFRFEAEAAMIWGSLENTNRTAGSGTDYNNTFDPDEKGWNLRQFGVTAQSEIRALEDKLRINLNFGFASGDPDVEGISPPAAGLQPQLTNDRTFSTFRMHPDYRVDLILWRNILNRVQGAYYFKPGVEYDFTRDTNGQRIGGGGSIIWSRASEFVQTPGNQRDLGIELDFKLYYQAKDGSLNDDLDKLGGFYTQLEYGVMFPLGGLGYLPQEEQDFEDDKNPVDLSTPQIVRWYLGIMF